MDYIPSTGRPSGQARPRFVRQDRPGGAPGRPQSRKSGENSRHIKSLHAAGFDRKSPGSFVTDPPRSSVSPGSLVDPPGSFVAGRCRTCNTSPSMLHVLQPAGRRMLQDMQHRPRPCCIQCNDPRADVARDATAPPGSAGPPARPPPPPGPTRRAGQTLPRDSHLEPSLPFEGLSELRGSGFPFTIPSRQSRIPCNRDRRAAEARARRCPDSPAKQQTQE